MISQFNEIKKRYQEIYGVLLGEMLEGKNLFINANEDDVFELFKRIGLHKHKNFLDLGSGYGNVTLIASLFTRATGIEKNKKLFEKSLKIRNELRLGAKFINSDFLKEDLSKYDVVFINPDKTFYELEKKLVEEFKGKLIVYGNIYKPLQLKPDKEIGIGGTPISIYTI